MPLDVLFPFIAVIVAAVIVLSLHGARLERQRQDAFGVAARALGWTYDPEGDPLWARTFASAPFGLGQRWRVGPTVTGVQQGRAVCAFDYTYFTRDAVSSTDAQGRLSTTYREQAHHYRVAVVRTGLLGPTLELGNENWLIRALDAVTGGDIDFESESFNRRFRVQCSSRKFAYDVLTPATMEAIEILGPDRLVWENGWLVWAQQGSWLPSLVEPMLTRLQRIVDCLPAYLLAPSPAPDVDSDPETPRGGAENAGA